MRKKIVTKFIKADALSFCRFVTPRKYITDDLKEPTVAAHQSRKVSKAFPNNLKSIFLQ